MLSSQLGRIQPEPKIQGQIKKTGKQEIQKICISFMLDQ